MLINVNCSSTLNINKLLKSIAEIQLKLFNLYNIIERRMSFIIIHINLFRYN